jgi:hypothetical protein
MQLVVKIIWKVVGWVVSHARYANSPSGERVSST